MARREMVVNTIWDTELSDVSPTAKLVYLWSFTNPACGMAGVYPMPTKKIAAALDLEKRDAQEAINELAQHDLLWHDGTWLWVPARVKHLHTRTKQIASSIAKDMSVVPDGHPILGLFEQRYGTDGWIIEYVDLNLKRGSSEVQVNFSRGSESPIPKPDSEPHLNLTRTSSEVPLDVAVVVDVESGLTTNASSSTQPFTDLTPQPVVARETATEVTAIWDRYPHQRRNLTDMGLQNAIEAVADLEPATLAQIAGALAEDLESGEWKREGGRRIPSLSKWINERRWDRPLSSKEKRDLDRFAESEHPADRAIARLLGGSR